MAFLRALFVGAVLLAVGAWAETDLEARAKELIEDFRAIMPTGKADIGFPVLDPALIKNLPISVKIPPFDAKCVISNASVPGVSGFKFTKISQIAGTNKLSLDVELPDIDVNGLYNLTGRVKMGFVKVNLKGQGTIEVALKGLKGSATADVQVNNDGSLSLNSLKVDSWTYTQITIQLDNLMGGGVIGKTINKLINSLVSTFINVNRNKINSIIETRGKKLIDVFLASETGAHSHLLYHPHEDLAITIDETWLVPRKVQGMLDTIALAAFNAAPKDSSLVDRVMQLLEDFRTMMPHGRADLNIPVLDPCVILRMPVEVNLPPFDMSAVATEVSTAGVSAFIIHKLVQIEGTNQLAFNIEVPEVDVSGSYSMSGKVKIGFIDVNLNGGKGSFNLTMKGFKGTATADMIVNSDGSLNLNWLKFDSWNFDSIKAETDNAFMNKYVYPLVNKLAPLFLELNRGWINNWGQNVAKVVVNRYLNGISGKTSVTSFASLSSGAVGAKTPSFVVSREAQEVLDELALVLATQPRHLARLQ